MARARRSRRSPWNSRRSTLTLGPAMLACLVLLAGSPWSSALACGRQQSPPNISAPPGGVGPPDGMTPPNEGTSAAEKYGWTKLSGGDEFDGAEPDSSRWELYDSPGHAGNGVRSPGQISVVNGVLRIAGTADGTTGGMALKQGQTYGRWETRARFPTGCACYHPVLLLWATDGGSGVANPSGEIDYAEVFDPERQELNFFLHYQDLPQLNANTTIDMTRWHNFAIEWTPEHLAWYVDGEEFFRTGDPSALPRTEMNQTVQLDWFPGDSASHTAASMEVDWVRQYEL
jgi:beta-glucanase (GH16 family)